jgi:hypothetical protein
MSKIGQAKILGGIGLLLLIVLSLSASASQYYDYSDYTSWAAAGAAVCFLFVIIWFVVFILIGIWVYKDAEKRGKSGILWLVIVILLGIVGIIIWLAVRPPIGGEKKEIDRRCPNCGRVIPLDAKICPYCKKDFEKN